MGFGAIEQLIARGQPSPITSALQGFQTGAQIMPSIRMAQLAPALRQAQTQLAQAQAAKALQQAQTGFGGQTLTGPAGQAQSDILFKQKYADQPEKLQELTNATNRVERAANARWWVSVPSDERAQVLGRLKALGIDQVKATQLLSQGHSLQDIINSSQVTQKPLPAGAPTSRISGANTATPDTIKNDIADAKEQAKPIRWQDVTPNFAQTEATKTQAQHAAAASAGLDYLGKYVASHLDYGGITSKITRPWLQDIYSHDPTKQQKAVDYYVAQAVKPELALLRIRIQGGQPSARAMAAIAPTILGTINVDMSNLPAKMQKRVQQKATDILNEAAYQTEAQTFAPNPGVYNPKVQEQASQNISSVTPAAPITPTTPQQPTTAQTVRIRLPDGRVGAVPLKNLDQAIKMGAKRI
jgi:hypothetical protein